MRQSKKKNAYLQKCWFKISILSTAAASVTFCKPVGSQSEVKVVGGVEDYDSNPAAVGIVINLVDSERACTATIVRDDLLLTAAHCLHGAKKVAVFDSPGENMKRPLLEKQLISTNFVVFPTYQDDTSPNLHNNSDVAFVVYAKGAFSGFQQAKITETPPRVGQAVKLVGYGTTDQSENMELKRFSGSNSIAEIDSTRASHIWLATNTVGRTTAGLGHGDSGGPLFSSGGEVIGVAHSGNFKLSDKPSNQQINQDNQVVSGYINVTDPGISSFIKAVMNDPNPTSATGQSAVPTPYQTPGASGAGGNGGDKKDIAPGCSYADAAKYGGWGYDSSTGKSCPPQQGGSGGSGGSGGAPDRSGCSYADAAKNNGWGFNSSTGKSCPPQ